MPSIANCFENFAFKAFTFDDTATPKEYWLVMPVIWAMILFLFALDARDIWSALAVREKVSLNPLSYASVMFFVITLVPRFSLTVRRLHDSGKRGKWAMLPVTCVVSGFWLVVGLCAALVASGAGGSGSAGSAGLAALSLFAILTFSAIDSLWEVAFAVVAGIEAIGFNALWAALSEIFAASSGPKVQIDASQITDRVAAQPFESVSIIIWVVGAVCTPFVAAFLHLYFMICPTIPDKYDSYSTGGGALTTLRKQGETSHNPFEGYKYLYDLTPEQEAAKKARAAQEIKDLYRQRVLGQS